MFALLRPRLTLKKGEPILFRDSMKLKDLLRQIKSNPKDVWYYIQGNLRMFLYKHQFLRWMIRKHIQEQYIMRTFKASDCYENGECLCCGCRTPNLFFANKGCSIAKHDHCKVRISSDPCYDKMLSRSKWKKVVQKKVP